MNLTEPLVSVIIPTYNRANFIGACIQSVLDQTMQDFEMWVMDDGSTDDTEAAVKRFSDARIHYHRDANSGRPAVPRNRGAERSRGRWLAFLDSDDLWLPIKLERQLEAAARHPEAALIYSLAERFDESGRYGATTTFHRLHSGRIFKQLLFRNCIPTLTALLKKDVFLKCGPFDTQPDFKAVEDYDLWLRVAFGHPVHAVPEILARYRLHTDNISQDVFLGFAKWEKVLSKIFQDLPVPQELQRRAIANLYLGKFKFSLRKRLPKAEALAFLHRAVAIDPSFPAARLASATTSLGGYRMLEYTVRKLGTLLLKDPA